MTSENVEEKVLIACFFCERELRVPLTYSGMVRCPTCSKKFLIKSPEELKVDEGNLIDEENKKVIRDKKDLPEIKIFNNCLLYTSPSPRDMRRSRMPSSA